MPVNKYQEFIPHPVLQDYVKRFWILEKEYTAEDSVEEVTPDACVELILNFGRRYVRVDATNPRELPNICLVGLLSKPLKLQANGLVKILAARFFAWGALPFLQHDVASGNAVKVELDSAWNSLVANISAKVHANEYQKAVEQLEDFLIGRRLNTLFEPRQIQAAAKL